MGKIKHFYVDKRQFQHKTTKYASSPNMLAMHPCKPVILQLHAIKMFNCMCILMCNLRLLTDTATPTAISLRVNFIKTPK